MQNLMSKFIKDESGATAIEYGLIAALIAVALIGGASAIGGSLNTKFTTVSAEINKAGTTPAPTAPTTP